MKSMDPKLSNDTQFFKIRPFYDDVFMYYRICVKGEPPPRTFSAKFRRVYLFIPTKPWSSQKSSNGLTLFYLGGVPPLTQIR